MKERLVSYHDSDVHPIQKGKAGKKVQFGMVSQIEEAENGIIVGYQVYKGNPSDKTLMPDAIDNHKKIFGKPPREVSADRGYYTSKLDDDLHGAGVKNVCVPKIGKKSKAREAEENTAKFKELKSYRAGVEARISCLKHSFGFGRSMLRGISGAKTWCGYGFFAHNLRQAARLMVNS
ncbi:transposase [Lutispora sp.]|uniref:transposase n=1 Tax=Lutispora sp. TaxID=2828727 RepID=UPI002B207C9F|nr:transposase [Lutispora sp.]MEA4962398.1 transposase [Lutispora sp.]